MHTKRHISLLMMGLAASLALVGCASDGATDEDVEADAVDQPIIGGEVANAYTEAALINGPGFICSGAIIAPRIALTAGHCVKGGRFTVVAPFANNQRSTATKTWTPYESTGSYVNPNSLDVGVIILDTPINLPAYPPYVNVPVADNTAAVNVGRIQDGRASNTALFRGKEIKLRVDTAGAPNAYRSERVIQSGDSGGPVYTGSGKDRKIVAVNSGAGGNGQVLARVDMAFTKIRELIDENGGPGVTLPGPDTNPGGLPEGCTKAESEPNNHAASANGLEGTACGGLGASEDVDWFHWKVDAAGIRYDLALEGNERAELAMWKNTPTGWKRVVADSPRRFAATSRGAGLYLVAVFSRSGATGAYKLSLDK